MKTTLSVIKADVGSVAGHVKPHRRQIEVAKASLGAGVERGIIEDFYVANAGDDINLIMTHTRGSDSEEVHGLAWDTFTEITEKVSKPLKLYGAGQDLVADSFSGNVRGMGPGVAEVEFEERHSDPVAVFMADKTEPGAWNLPLYRIFADPFNTAGLVIDPSLHEGFSFTIVDILENREVTLHCPEETYDLLGLIGTTSRYIIKEIHRRKDGLISAAASTSRLSLIAGRYIGKDDPVAIVRSQHGLPAMGEILEAFAFPHLVSGWMRGSHVGPLLPVGLKDSRVSRFDGPPRVVGLGFNVSNAELVGPEDLFDDPAFDDSRQKALEVTDFMRRHGPFMPHRLGPEEMEYTTLPQILEKLSDRFEDLEEEEPVVEQRIEAPE